MPIPKNEYITVPNHIQYGNQAICLENFQSHHGEAARVVFMAWIGEYFHYAVLPNGNIGAYVCHYLQWLASAFGGPSEHLGSKQPPAEVSQVGNDWETKIRKRRDDGLANIFG